jgi:hypothetical protein
VHDQRRNPDGRQDVGRVDLAFALQEDTGHRRARGCALEDSPELPFEARMRRSGREIQRAPLTPVIDHLVELGVYPFQPCPECGHVRHRGVATEQLAKIVDGRMLRVGRIQKQRAHPFRPGRGEHDARRPALRKSEERGAP